MKLFVMAMRQGPDNDLLVQVTDATSTYRQQRMIVKIPPRENYCDARSALMELFRADGGTSLQSYVFKP